jgi:predicted MFS family arabinose efflux permease
MRATEACVDVPTPEGAVAGQDRTPLSTLLPLFLCSFAGQATLLTLSPLLPDIAAEFGVATATVGQLRALSGLVAGIAAVAIAVKPPPIPLRSVLYWGLGSLALGSVASATAPSYLWLAAAQVPIGVGIALLLGGALAASDRWSPIGGSSRLLSWTLLGQPAAWIVGMPVVGVIAGRDWRLAWIAVPLVSALLAAVALLWHRGIDAPEPGLSLRDLARRAPLRRWAIGELLGLSAWAGTLIYCGALFIESYGVSTATTGLILSGVAAGYVPGNALFRRWVDTAPHLLLVGLALGLAAFSIPFGALRGSIVASIAFITTLAFLAGGRTIAGSALGLAVGGENKMSVMSLRTAALQFGYLFGGAIGGAALNARGYGATGVVFSLLFLASALVHGTGRERPRRS